MVTAAGGSPSNVISSSGMSYSSSSSSSSNFLDVKWVLKYLDTQFLSGEEVNSEDILEYFFPSASKFGPWSPCLITTQQKFDEHNTALAALRAREDGLVGALKSLQATQVIDIKYVDKSMWYLTPEGLDYAIEGTPDKFFMEKIIHQYVNKISNDSISTPSRNTSLQGREPKALATTEKHHVEKKDKKSLDDLGRLRAIKNCWAVINSTTKLTEPMNGNVVLHTFLYPKTKQRSATPTSLWRPPSLPTICFPFCVPPLPAFIDKSLPLVFDLAAEFLRALQNTVPGAILGAKEAKVFKAFDYQRNRCQSLVDDIEKIASKTLNMDMTTLWEPHEILQEFKRRKWVEIHKGKEALVRRGPNFSVNPNRRHRMLTADNLRDGTWTDIDPTVAEQRWRDGTPCKHMGSFHVLGIVKQRFAQIFQSMGFQEMRTDRYVESSFWNFDALYTAQRHPARSAHDTFFLKWPEKSELSRILPPNYLEKVKEVHEAGGYGSIGYRYKWLEDFASTNILRSHTTGVSALTLCELARKYSEGGLQGVKSFYSIDVVFRNETLDATHLAEFHQVEGMVIGRGLGPDHLKYTLGMFYSKIGITKLRFKQAYNPYTAPSMEVFGYHEGLNKWVEVGNSGLFRMEVLRPMGMPEDVSVIAWGLSLERPTMINYKISNIRKLFGSKALISNRPFRYDHCHTHIPNLYS